MFFRSIERHDPQSSWFLLCPVPIIPSFLVVVLLQFHLFSCISFLLHNFPILRLFNIKVGSFNFIHQLMFELVESIKTDSKENICTHHIGRNLAYFYLSRIHDCCIVPFNFKNQAKTIFILQSSCEITAWINTIAYFLFALFILSLNVNTIKVSTQFFDFLFDLVNKFRIRINSFDKFPSDRSFNFSVIQSFRQRTNIFTFQFFFECFHQSLVHRVNHQL